MGKLLPNPLHPRVKLIIPNPRLKLVGDSLPPSPLEVRNLVGAPRFVQGEVGNHGTRSDINPYSNFIEE